MNTEARRIVGVFGGTFDPPHAGHLGLARNALASKRVDEIWFVPCLIHRFGKTPAPFADRVAMCELLIRGDRRLKVSTIEKELEKPGHTLDLVTALIDRYPGYAFRLLAGTDIYHEREKWHLWDEIARLAPPVYVERLGAAPIPEPTLPAPEGIRSSELREKLRCGKPVGDAIAPSVLDYIRSHGLYR